ncbi:unnamed protein product, partial [Didymodactylos carnosus]
SKFEVQLAIFKQSPQSYHLYQLKNPTSIDELIYKCGWSTDDDTDRFKKAIAELNGPGIIFEKKAKDDNMLTIIIFANGCDRSSSLELKLIVDYLLDRSMSFVYAPDREKLS